MSKYSMEDKYNENEKYNIADLCMEISKEYYEIKEKFPDSKITIETSDKCATVRLGDALIYVSMTNDLVVDAE